MTIGPSYENPMASAAGTGSATALFTLKKGLQQEAGQMAQLLSSMPAPQAPAPAHLGKNFDCYA